jgi:hypothetical protein
MNTIEPIAISSGSKHHVTLTVADDCPRLTRLVAALSGTGLHSPYRMTRARAGKVLVLRDCGFDADGDRIFHSVTRRTFRLSDALMTAEVVSAQRSVTS